MEQVFHVAGAAILSAAFILNRFKKENEVDLAGCSVCSWAEKQRTAEMLRMSEIGQYPLRQSCLRGIFAHAKL